MDLMVSLPQVLLLSLQFQDKDIVGNRNKGKDIGERETRERDRESERDEREPTDHPTIFYSLYIIHLYDFHYKMDRIVLHSFCYRL